MRFVIGLLIGSIAAVAFERGLYEDLLQLASPTPASTTQFSTTAAATQRPPEKQPEQDLLPAEVEPAAAQPRVTQALVQLQEEPGLAQSPERTEVIATEITDAIFQVAWMPFRSEASASGFAQKLSYQLNREFEAIRIGRGRYEVGFHYENSDDRDQVLGAIEQMTGYRVPDPS